MLRLLTLAIPVVVLGAAAAQDDTAKELKRFEGAWMLTLVEVSGKPVSDEDKAKFRIKIEFKGDAYKAFFDDKLVVAGTLKLDPTKKPATIDATLTEGPQKGKIQLGIYKFDGEDLTTVFNESGKDRPTSFKTREGTEEVLVTYKRVAKK